MKSSQMTTYILIAMLLGIAVGGIAHATFADGATQKLFASYVSIGSMVFLRLIKMIIAPLVFSTLVVGIGHMVVNVVFVRLFVSRNCFVLQNRVSPWCQLGIGKSIGA